MGDLFFPSFPLLAAKPKTRNFLTIVNTFSCSDRLDVLDYFYNKSVLQSNLPTISNVWEFFVIILHIAL